MAATTPLPVAARRRKLRSDTHSCRECRRRKLKCVFEDQANRSVCQGCLRRGSECISQLSPNPETSRRLSSEQTANPLSTGCTPSSQTLRQSPRSSSDNLAKFLHDRLPSVDDTRRIFAALPSHHIVPHEIMTMPYTSLASDEAVSRPERKIPDPNTHPVLIARHMLFLASLLQHLHPDMHPGLEELAETPQDMSMRLVELAIRHVTSEDKLLGSVEGLICIMMESVYHINAGNLRRSWVTARRAITVAQLMGFDSHNVRLPPEILDKGVKYDKSVIWSRLLFLDRFLCLLLGLPQACSDRIMGDGVDLNGNDPHLAKLEQVHCMVASGIIERNSQAADVGSHFVTSSLDQQLIETARDVPSGWWLIPDFTKLGMNGSSPTWEIGRLFAQILHYNLLNQLHLPYMLQHNLQERNNYALVTCVSASREILLRSLAVRRFNNVTPSCRIIDFVALMAAMTLVLAHLDCQHLGSSNLLAHQYHSDRAMVEQVQEYYRLAASGLQSDPISTRSADLLEKLLSVDMAAFAHATGRVTLTKHRPDEVESVKDSAEGVVRVAIPYFGVIQLARQAKRTLHAETSGSDGMMTSAGHKSAHGLWSAAIENSQTDIPDLSTASEHQDGLIAPGNVLYGDLAGLAASDWALQGVDSAYFNSLTMYHGMFGE